VRVALLTISDSRTEETDTAGRAARALVAEAGHALVDYAIVRDEPELVQAYVRALEGRADLLVTAGGTGITARDRTFEAITGLVDRELPGFGELFRSLSFAEIGAAAMLSRAVAGTVGKMVLFCCPGSEGAVRLALTRLILPEAGHLVREVQR
jgi:molybdenum cofactor biosynthesis protein B